MKIILASASPRRKELLKMITDQYEVIVSNVEEIVDEKLEPERKAEEISYLKGKAVYDQTEGDRVIISADTIVSKNKKIYGKPKDKEDAVKMIRELQEGNRTHEVISGLTVIINKNGKNTEYKTHDNATVTLKEISDEEIENWINTGKAMDKAGAYAIQEEFGVFVEKINGDYMSIVGLPVSKLYDILKKEEILND